MFVLCVCVWVCLCADAQMAWLWSRTCRQDSVLTIKLPWSCSLTESMVQKTRIFSSTSWRSDSCQISELLPLWTLYVISYFFLLFSFIIQLDIFGFQFCFGGRDLDIVVIHEVLVLKFLYVALYFPCFTLEIAFCYQLFILQIGLLLALYIKGSTHLFQSL